MAEFKLPTEVIDLPSKGLLYPKDNPLSEGKIEIKYMTAKEEDILSNVSYIQKGIVLDKLFESLIVSKVNYDDLLIGDKNAVMIAARVLGYGNEYTFDYNGKQETVDLSQLDFVKVNENDWTNGNNFSFQFPNSKTNITFKLLNHGDEQKILKEVNSLKKLKKDSDSTLSTRLKYMITSVEGDDTTKTIRDFVDNYLLARDSRALREYINTINPDIDLSFFPEDGESKRAIPIGLSLFWPDVNKLS
jgi:hypothetical protein|tara:strand:- start:2702 stop:3439 length:738 start_codon:yes stop_codon:yes gene_type:complete